MLPSGLHLAVAAVLAALTVGALRIWSRSHRSYTLIVVAVLAGLTYDNAVLGLGRWIGHGEVLESLTVPRFVIHALVTPLLIVVGIGAARAFRLGWARSAGVHAAFCVAATALVVLGVATEVVGQELVPESEGGIVSYGAATSSAPIPAIATIVALLAVGALVWRAAGWPWLAAGAAVMLVASGLGGISGLLTNVGELALALSLVVTERESAERRGSTAPVRWARSTARQVTG